jgi:O-antigen/teichoic acid export membrane protein
MDDVRAVSDELHTLSNQEPELREAVPRPRLCARRGNEQQVGKERAIERRQQATDKRADTPLPRKRERQQRCYANWTPAVNRADPQYHRLTTVRWAHVRRLVPRASLWALADQGVVSLGTFLTSVLVARNLPPAEYGVYILIFGTVIFLNGVQGSLIGFPLAIKGAAADREGLEEFTSAALALTGGLAVVLAVVVIGATIAVRRIELTPWALAALLLWQWQDCLRRALMSHGRYRDAMLGDALSFLGQAAVLWVISRVGSLSTELAFTVVAVTSGLSGLLQAAQVGLRVPTLASLRRCGLEFWSLGRWLMLTNFTNILTIQAFPWTLAYFHGLESAAQFQATANVMGVSHPVMFSMSNLIVPAVARARATDGVRAAWRVAAIYGGQAGLLLLPYFVLLLVWPDGMLELFYGADSPYLALEEMVRLFVLVYCFRYVVYVLGGVLRGLQAGQSVFLGQLAGALAALFIGLPLAAVSAIGAVGGVVISAASEALATAYLLRRAL